MNTSQSITPREVLQELVNAHGFTGRIQYVSQYTSTMPPGWYITQMISRVAAVWDHDAIRIGRDFGEARDFLLQLKK